MVVEIIIAAAITILVIFFLVSSGANSINFALGAPSWIWIIVGLILLWLIFGNKGGKR